MRLALLGLFAASAAHAVPTMTHSGRVTDAAGGPINGTFPTIVELVDAGDNVVWTESHSVTFEDGYFAVLLGTSTDLDADVFGGDLDIITHVDGQELTRQDLTYVPQALAVNGRVQVGAVTTCDAASAGTLRWQDDALSVCDGTGWRSVASSKDGSTQAQASVSCAQLHADFPQLDSGAYWIDPDGVDPSDAHHLWCDMENDGGGWTLVASLDNVGSAYTTQAAVNVGLLDSAAWPVGDAKIPDADINLLGSEFRHTIQAYGSYNRYYLLNNDLHLGSVGQVRVGDRCKASYAQSWVTLSTAPTSTIRGVGSSTDGCGSCGDLCGGGGGTGSWWSWNNHSTTSTGSYSRVTAYTNGWLYVR